MLSSLCMGNLILITDNAPNWPTAYGEKSSLLIVALNFRITCLLAERGVSGLTISSKGLVALTRRPDGRIGRLRISFSCCWAEEFSWKRKIRWKLFFGKLKKIGVLPPLMPIFFTFVGFHILHFHDFILFTLSIKYLLLDSTVGGWWNLYLMGIVINWLTLRSRLN